MKTIIYLLLSFFLIATSAENREEFILYSYFALGILFVFFSIYVFIYYKKKIKRTKDMERLTSSLYSKVVGVTFKNDDGSSRQNNIKKYVKEGNELYVKGYNYKGKSAVAILAKENKMNTQIGNLSAELVKDLSYLPADTEFMIIAKNITGGTTDKKTVGVNIEILSSRRI